MVVPYIQRLSECFKKVYGKHGLQVYFKGGQTIKGLIVAPKDKDLITKKSEDMIYKHKCGRVDMTIVTPQVIQPLITSV